MLKRILLLVLLCFLAALPAVGLAKSYKVFDAETGKKISGEAEQEAISDFVSFGMTKYGTAYFYVYTDTGETYVNLDNKSLWGKSNSEDPRKMYEEITPLNKSKKVIKPNILKFREKYYPGEKSSSKHQVEKLIKKFDLEDHAKGKSDDGGPSIPVKDIILSRFPF